MSVIACPGCGYELVVVVKARNEVPTNVQALDWKSNDKLAKLRDRAWLASEYQAKSAQLIASEVGCDPATVLKWLRRHAIAIRRAGLHPPRDQDQAKDKTRAAAIEALRAWAEEHDGVTPSQAVWRGRRPFGAPSITAISNVFGSWNEGLRAAGLTPRKPGEKLPVPGEPQKKSNLGRNRQMVTGRGLNDQLPGTVKHINAA